MVESTESFFSCIRRCKRDTHHTHNCSFVSQLFVKAHVRWSRVCPASVLLFLFWLFSLPSLSLFLSVVYIVGAVRCQPIGATRVSTSWIPCEPTLRARSITFSAKRTGAVLLSPKANGKKAKKREARAWNFVFVRSRPRFLCTIHQRRSRT